MLHFLVASLLLLLHSGRLAPIQDGVSGLFVVGIGLLLALSHLKARWGHAAGIAAACVSSALLPGATGLLILGIAVTLVCPPGVYRQGIAFLACTLFLFATGLVPPPLVNLSEAAYQAIGQTVAPGVAGAWLVPLAVASVWRAAVPPGGRRWSRPLLMLAICCLLLVGLEVVVCAAYTTRAVFVAIPLLQLGILSAWAALLSMPNPAVVIRAPVGSRRHWLWLAAPAVVAGTLAPGWSERSVDSIAFYNEGGLDWDVPTAGKYGSYEGGMFGLLPVRLQREGFRVAAIEPEADIVAELQHHQVLFVINCPRHWSDEICAGIAAWVRDGGQLVVLADHTDVFGLMPGTNRLLANWAIGVRFDSAYHAREGWAGCIAAQAPGWTGAHRGFQLTHGIGASLTIGGEARSLFHGRWAFSDLGLRENFAGSFLGNYHWDRNEPFGDQVLVAQALDGRGAVTVYGDTTAFQNGALAGSLENHVLPLFGWLPRQPSAMRARMARCRRAVAAGWTGSRVGGTMSAMGPGWSGTGA